METRRGRVFEALNGRCAVYCDGEMLDCAVRGSFRKEGLFPKAGDYVGIAADSETVVTVEPRKNGFIRPAVANIDLMFIVSSLADPPPSTEAIDKMTVVSEYGGVTPVVVFTKSDIASDDGLTELYRHAGIECISVSADDDSGLGAIRRMMSNKTSVFTGFSGVGKSSLVNRLCPEINSEVGELSERSGRGKNTTRRATLFRCGDFWIADTPGFSSLDLTVCCELEKDSVKDCFPEFATVDDCRFTGCLHLPGTKGCAVCAALSDGQISASRYNNYLKFYEMFAQKRKKR